MAESKKNIWNELYQAAAALRDANPWKVLTPKDLFGIEESESKEINFCAFFGPIPAIFLEINLAIDSGEVGIFSKKENNLS